MKKEIYKEIYKEIPENFHRKFCLTLADLEETPSRRGHCHKKYALLLAAAILACASVTAAAVGIRGWHERMSARFGTEKELEDKLRVNKVTVPQSSSVEKGGLKFQALEALRTDAGCYFLIQMTVPEQIRWNEDILFEECGTVNQDIGCTAGFVSGSLENHTVLLEIQLLYDDTLISDTRQIHVRLKNLIQTKKTATVECLVEGEWEVPLTLPPAEADTVVFYPEAAVELGEHVLTFPKAEVSPFRLCLYTNKDFALHAAWAHRISLAGVWYEDGTRIKESGPDLSLCGHAQEPGEFCFETFLENAVDTDKIAGILLDDGGKERRVPLMPSQEQRADAAGGSAGASGFAGDEGPHYSAESDAWNTRPSGFEGEEEPHYSTESGACSPPPSGFEGDEELHYSTESGACSPPPSGFEGDRRVSGLRLLYVRYGNVVVADEASVYLWDALCGGLEEMFSLKEYGFSQEAGGEFSFGQGCQMQMFPYEDSDKVYLYDMADKEMLTLEAETFWPWPVHEVYEASCREISELLPEADERYSGQAFCFQGNWYYLYSRDGLVRNMELKRMG